MKFKKRSNKYWIERSDKRMELAHRNANEVTAEVQRSYDKAIEQINKDMDSILTNFSKLDGMTKDEAIKLLNERISAKKIEEIRAEIKTLPDGPIKAKLVNKLNAQAYRARMTRKQALKEKVQIECARVADVEYRASNKFYTKQIKETYYRNMFDVSQGFGYAIDFTMIPTKRVEEILKANWSGKHFSSRIWNNSQAFADKIQELLLRGAMEGKNSRVLAKELEEYAKVGKHVSERLLRTETTYVSTMADLEAAKERDTEELEFVATLDSRTSPQCQQHDGKHIKVKDAKPGVNVPPLHCYCRSTVIEVIDGLEHKVRFARDKNGKGIQVPADMKYPEWKEKFIANSGKDDILEVVETIHKSVGAKSKNYDVYNPLTGDYMQLAEGTKITQPKNHVMAGKGRVRQIDCEDWLSSKYADAEPGKWTKEKGFGFVNDEYGDTRKVELHWYQNPKTGKVEMKAKEQLNGGIYIDED